MKADIFNPTLPNNIAQTYYWNHLQGASIGLCLANAIQLAKRPILVIAPDNLTVSHLQEELQFFLKNEEILSFPDWETLPYDHFSPHQDIVSERLRTLYRLPSAQSGVMLTAISTLMQRLPPRNYLDGQSFFIKLKDKINLDILRTRLSNAGYYNVSQVREHGEFAIRGSIIDLFPMGSTEPFRIDLFDDEVDSIRVFSPETQRTLEKIDEIRLLPAKEFPLTETAIDQFRQSWRGQFSGNPLKSPLYQDMSEGICAPGIEYYFPLFFSETATLFDYLPSNMIIISVGGLLGHAQEFWKEIETRYNQAAFDITRPLLKPQQLYINESTVFENLKKFPQVKINATSPKSPEFDFATELPPALDINHKASVPLQPLQSFVSEEKGRILFTVESIGRQEVTLQLFKTIQLQPTLLNTWQQFINSQERIGMVVAPIETGFKLKNPPLTLLTESQLYGKRVMQRRLRKQTVQDPDTLIRNLTELQINDAVVHIDHGIGRYRGLQTLTVGEQVNEFLTLEYQGGDKLYVPVSSLHLINRYTGSDPENIPINKLGTEQWARTKRKAAEKVKDVAVELLDLYAKRAAKPGHIYQIPTDYEHFAAAFPFEETPDQLNAIEQVFKDMTSPKPMDRVICGDVGFGKTEVAMRAAFLAVQNNKQVALLVPTTLLAQQHFQNFQDRFAQWPIQIEMVSRFRTAKAQKSVLEKVADGKVDILIGTHKLLQKDIIYKNLGLAIIDEEHRFGVKQKEKLKSLRADIDILTLTATPIPRTLNMALAGMRDLSVIATPPARRLSVKTFLHTYQNNLVQEAIQRELLRGGQVYFLHNDISTINKKAEELNKLVHEARVTVAHGQMHERELERVMAEFYHRKHNVLVCSTIIESGIDIPTANTIIINRADKFGIAQLHQLRGRVGRSHHQAYAYLLTPAKENITADALKRLNAVTAYDDLGIGFTLATHDLEIRGAGELLGEEQSGDMQEVGFSLYMDLLSRAVDALKHGEQPSLETTLQQQEPEIDLHVTALIPEQYMYDVQLRLSFYKRIASAKTVAELDEIQVDLIDRFGLLPPALKNLFAITELKLQAKTLGILKIEASDKSGRLDFVEKPNVKPETILRLIQHPAQRFRLEGPTRLRFVLNEHELNNRIANVKAILDELS